MECASNCTHLHRKTPKRFSQRRHPEDITSLQQPFDPDSFNFHKIHHREVRVPVADCPLLCPSLVVSVLLLSSVGFVRASFGKQVPKSRSELHLWVP